MNRVQVGALTLHIHTHTHAAAHTRTFIATHSTGTWIKTTARSTKSLCALGMAPAPTLRATVACRVLPASPIVQWKRELLTGCGTNPLRNIGNGVRLRLFLTARCTNLQPSSVVTLSSPKYSGRVGVVESVWHGGKEEELIIMHSSQSTTMHIHRDDSIYRRPQNTFVMHTAPEGEQVEFKSSPSPQPNPEA